jgi:hypothetical protein
MKKLARCYVCKWKTPTTKAWQARLARHAKTHARTNGPVADEPPASNLFRQRPPSRARVAFSGTTEAKRDATFRAEVQHQLREHIMAEVRRQLETLR